MRALRFLAILILLTGLAVAQGPGGNDWRPVGESDDWKYYVEWGSLTNDNFYSRWDMRGVHKLTGQQVDFEVECQKSKNRYRTIGSGQVSVTANSYKDIPPGSVIEEVYLQVKDLRRGDKR